MPFTIHTTIIYQVTPYVMDVTYIAVPTGLRAPVWKYTCNITDLLLYGLCYVSMVRITAWCTLYSLYVQPRLVC